MRPSEYDFLRRFIERRSAIVLDAGQPLAAERKLESLARIEGLGSVPELMTRLRRHGGDELHDKVVDAIANNETQFFRDVHPFRSLASTLLPELIERRALERRLVIWCAAASSGQEPYSLAMLIKERFPFLCRWDLQIIATDISTRALAQAREGRYSDLEVGRGLHPRMLATYFTRVGREWQISEEIRRMVELRELNIRDPWVMPPVDVLFLRNVLIYFSPSTRKDVLSRAARTVRRDGLLFLGSAETVDGCEDAWARVSQAESACYRPRPRREGTHER